MSTDTLQAYLDEYLIASDYLAEGGFPTVAESLRDAAHRVLAFFTAPGLGGKYDVKTVHWRDGWAYATDGRVAIRFRATEPIMGGKTEGSRKTLEAIDGLFDKWQPTGQEMPFTVLESYSDQFGEPFKVTLSDGRDISSWLLWRINKLPDVAYFLNDDDPEGRVDFQFRCGEGCVMPLKKEQS